MDERNHRISELMKTGLSQREIGRELGISGPAVAQRISRSPELRRLRTQCSRSEQQRLRAYQTELRQTQVAVQRLDREIKRTLETLDQELLSIEVDHVLGFRE